jgi:hypothetical protein
MRLVLRSAAEVFEETAGIRLSATVLKPGASMKRALFVAWI